jgi:hypothetical protein
MALLVPNVGEVKALSYLVNKATPDDLKLHLYTNNKTPAEADTVSDYTECAVAGYALATLTGATWTVATDGSNNSTATYPQVTFTFTAATTCYGYYVTNNSNATLMWAEAFPSSFAIPSGGGSISITLNIGAD